MRRQIPGQGQLAFAANHYHLRALYPLTKVGFGSIACLILTGLVHAQNVAPGPRPSPSPGVPVFPAEASIVHIDAVVTTRDGLQVADLRAADFEIESDGRRFPVAIANYVSLANHPVSGLVPGMRKLRAQEVRRVITFIISRPTIEMRSGSNTEANMLIARRLDRMLKRFVSIEARPNDLVAIVNADSRKPLLNQFTASPDALTMAVDLLRREWHNPDMQPITLMGDFGPLVRYSLEVVELAQEVVNRLREIPGRKLMFVVSALLPISGPRFSEVKHAIEGLAEQANRSGVTIYGIGPGGLGSGSSEALRLLAEETGGSTIENTELLGENLDKVMELNRGYYLLGYDPGKSPDRQGRRVKVHVRPEGLRVAARPRAYQDDALSTDPSSRPRRWKLEDLLNSPIAADGFSVRTTPYVRWTGPKTGDLQTVVEIDLRGIDLGSDDSSPSVDLDVLSRIVDQRGTVLKAERFGVKSRLKEGQLGPLRFAVEASLASPGLYQVDIAASDNRSGRQGNSTSLTSLIDLSVSKKALLASSLALRSADQPTDMPSDQFSARSSLALSCTIAHVKRGKNGREARLRIQARILSDGNLVMELLPQELSQDLPDLVEITGEISLSGLPPGQFVAELEITDLLGEKGQNNVRPAARFTVLSPLS